MTVYLPDEQKHENYHIEPCKNMPISQLESTLSKKIKVTRKFSNQIKNKKQMDEYLMAQFQITDKNDFDRKTIS